MRRATLWSALGFLAVLAMAAAWLWTADLGFLRPHLERAVSDVTGRDFAIDGRFSVDLGGETVIVAEGIRLQNADWAGPDSMLEVGHAEIRLDLWSLFGDRIEIGLVDVRDARAHLVRREEGEPNWTFEGRSDASTRDESAGAGTRELKLGRVHVERFDLTFESPERDGPVDIHVDHLRKDDRDDGFVEATLAGTVGGRSMSFEASAGPADALRERRDVQLQVAGRLDTFAFSATGMIDDLARPARPSFALTASGPDVNDVGRMFAVDAVGEGDIDLRASLQPVPGGDLAFDVDGNFGQLDVEGQARFSDLADLRRADVTLAAAGPNLGRILRLVGAGEVADSPFLLNLDAERDGGRLTIREAVLAFGNARLTLVADFPSFPALDDGRAELDLNGPDIAYFRSLFGLPGVASGAFSADLDYTGIADGDDEIALDVRTALGRLTATGTLGPAPRYHGSRADLTVSLDDLAALRPIDGLERLPGVPLRAGGSLEFGVDGVRTAGPLTLNANDITARIEGNLPLPDVTGSRATMRLAGPDLSRIVGMFVEADFIPALPYTVAGEVSLTPSRLRLDRIEGTIGRSEATLDGLVAFRPGIAGSRFNLEASGPAMEELTTSIPALEPIPGPYRLSGSLGVGDGELELTDVRLDRDTGHAALGMTLALPVTERRAGFQVSARGPDVRSLFSGAGAFAVAELPFAIRASGRLSPERLSIEEFRSEVGELRSQARGSVILGGPADSAILEVDVEVPDLSELGTWDGIRFNPQRLAFEARLSSDGSVIKADEMQIVIGESDAHGRIHYEPGPVPSLDIEIDSESLVVAPLLEEHEREYDPEPEFEDGRLIPALAVPFERLARIDAAIDVDIDHFVYKQLALHDVVLRATLRDGLLDLQRAGSRAHSGRFDIRGRVDPAGGTGRVSLDVLARDLALRPSPDDGTGRRRADVGIRLTGTGTDIRELAAGANGHIYIDSRGGQLISRRIVQMIYGDMLREILSTVNPFIDKSVERRLECIVVPLTIADGRLTAPANVFLRSDTLNISIHPEVDLRTEEIEIVFRTTPRKGLTISAAELINPYVKVVGTLASPGLAMDEKGALVRSGVAFATGGWSILAKAAWDRLRRSSDPCTEAVTAGTKALGGDPFPVFDAIPDDQPSREGPIEEAR